MIINQWDNYAKLFDEKLGFHGEKLHDVYISPLIHQYLGKQHYSSILDAGCGNGYLIPQLVKVADKIYGIDYSEEMVKITSKKFQKKPQIKILNANLLYKLPFENNKFDVIISCMVLQYIEQLETFSKEAYRVLKHNGKLIIVIDHPCHQLFLRAQELAGLKNNKFLSSDSYFVRSKRQKKSLWDKAILEYFHHPIEDYINLFTPKFYLRETDEVSEDGEMPRLMGFNWIKQK